jgi:hypothetical protein
MALENDLGRVRGLFVPVEEVETHLSAGWEILDQLSGDPLGRHAVLMRENSRQCEETP